MDVKELELVGVQQFILIKSQTLLKLSEKELMANINLQILDGKIIMDKLSYRKKVLFQLKDLIK
jgi:hypothetical protein